MSSTIEDYEYQQALKKHNHPTADSYGGAHPDEVWQDNVSYLQMNKDKLGIEGDLIDEMILLDGLHAQDPETGAALRSENGPALGNYTNRLFGCPYQLLDSVDKRFDGVNKNIGSEYMKHFILHSPILYIRPGMPRYTGDSPGLGLWSAFKDAWATSTSSSSDRGFLSSSFQSLYENTLGRDGARLQQRLFNFRETYTEYMMYVNYMCRIVANLLGLLNNPRFPNGTLTSKGGGDGTWEQFDEIRWENYRMSGAEVATNVKHLTDLFHASLLGTMTGAIGGALNVLNPGSENFLDVPGALTDTLQSMFGYENDKNEFDVMDSKIASVQFMVEPVSFQETLSNQTGESFIESAIDGIGNVVGNELAFITNSKVDVGILAELAGIVGNTAADALQSINGLVSGVSGGFMANLFDGAIGSIKGQKMIYPEIYKSSRSEMNYEFTVNLSSPYGDIYNYYMNIVAPVLHLVALAAPRMVSANTISSPFIVQSYIPGMCSCQMGIVKQMSIVKNKGLKHVSVSGFPLDVTVNFTIQELYNAMSISPAHDPTSFLFNETLNDYMANMAGLIPSKDTTIRVRDAAWKNFNMYFDPIKGELPQDVAASLINFTEDLIRLN